MKLGGPDAKDEDVMERPVARAASVYTFGGGAPHDDPSAKDKAITGGKGANLAEMAQIGLPDQAAQAL